MEKGAEVYSTLPRFAKQGNGVAPDTNIMCRMSPTTPLDGLLRSADNALRALFAPTAAKLPTGLAAEAPLSEPERRHAAGLMRVNHAGEIAAQALYHGQALFARDEGTRQLLLGAAAEEGRHLAWCETRLRELGARTSHLNPFWYAGSFVIGALAAAFDDKLSLGFVAETEKQVEGHLDQHLQQLPAADARSRGIVETMKADEMRHAETARAAGAAELPQIARSLMQATSRLMTHTAYRV